MTGELPEKKTESKPAESATADTPKEATPETPAESGPAKPQEQQKKGKDAEHRIKELLSEQKRLRAELEAMKTRPAQQAETPKPQQPQYTRPKPTVDAKNQDGTQKYGTYEDYIEDLADWKAEQRIAEQMRQFQAQSQQRQLAEGVEQARSRYENFDQIGLPVANAIVSDPQIPVGLKTRINNSKVLPDLLYTIGGDPQFMQRFVLMAKTDPEGARDVVALMERDIQEQLSKPVAKPQVETPAKRGPESAPAPPLETGNRGAAVDDTERLLEAAARGDRTATRKLLEAEQRKMTARRRGA